MIKKAEEDEKIKEEGGKKRVVESREKRKNGRVK